MNEEAQACLIFVLGAMALRLGVTDAHLAYVQPAMGPALALAGAVLAALGGGNLLRRDRAGRGDSDSHGHMHTGGSRVGWLLAAPVLAIAVVAPNPLGAFAADRAPSTLAPAARNFGPLPEPRAGAVDLPLTEFVGRGRQGDSLRGVPVRLVGFVTTDHRSSGFMLTRFVLSCCAADARPIRVAVRSADSRLPAPDAWLEVTGMWRPETRSIEDAHPPILDLTSLRAITPPENPYLR